MRRRPAGPTSARELDERVLRMRLDGASDAHIARELGVCRKVVYRRAERAWRRRTQDGLPRPIYRLVVELQVAQRLLAPPRRSAAIAAAVANMQGLDVAGVIGTVVRDMEDARAGLAAAVARLLPDVGAPAAADPDQRS